MFFYIKILFCDEKFIDIREIIINYYNELSIRGEDAQNFLINNLIKFLDGNLIKEKFEEGDEINILAKDKYFDRAEWLIQKINYFNNVIAPSPKIPYEFYKLSVSKDIPKYEKLLYLKKKSFGFKTESVESYGNVIKINEMNKKEDVHIYIEYLLIGMDNLEKIGDLKDGTEIIIKILFLHDKAPFSNYERKIKIFGILEGIIYK